MKRAEIERLYLFYFNDFLTIARFAEYHNISEELAEKILRIGRKLNHRRSKS